jgi:hypothetical protein
LFRFAYLTIMILRPAGDGGVEPASRIAQVGSACQWIASATFLLLIPPDRKRIQLLEGLACDFEWLLSCHDCLDQLRWQEREITTAADEVRRDVLTVRNGGERVDKSDPQLLGP